MKKAIITIALALATVGAFAQNAAEAFYPGWFQQIKGGAVLTAGETNWKDLVSPNAALSLGYQFTPVFGLRGELSAWQAKGALPALSDNGLYKYNFGQFNLDGVFDLCNLFGNYKYNRTLNPYIFAGVGVNARLNNDEAQAIKTSFPVENYLWEDPTVSFTGRVGLGLDIRLCDGLALTLEAADNVLSDHFNSKVGHAAGEDSKFDFDYNLAALAGLKFSFGQANKRKAAIAAEAAAAEAAALAAAKAAADKAAAEKAAAERAAAERAAAERAAAERAAAEKAAAEAARAKARATVENVYFTINKYNIREDQQPKVDHIIAVMKQYPEAVVSITGYADKFTGTAKRNMFLSQERAAVVAKALVDAGIAEDRISTNYYGDTKQVSDVPEENRVSICVTR